MRPATSYIQIRYKENRINEYYSNIQIIRLNSGWYTTPALDIVVQDHISISAGFVTLTSALVIGIVNGLVILKLGHTETFCLRSLVR